MRDERTLRNGWNNRQRRAGRGAARMAHPKPNAGRVAPADGGDMKGTMTLGRGDRDWRHGGDGDRDDSGTCAPARTAAIVPAIHLLHRPTSHSPPGHTAATGPTISGRPVALTPLPGLSRALPCDRSFAGTPHPSQTPTQSIQVPGSPSNFLHQAHHMPPTISGRPFRHSSRRTSPSQLPLSANFSGELLRQASRPPSKQTSLLPSRTSRRTSPPGLPAIHRERPCATERPAAGVSVPDGTKKGLSETPGGLPRLSVGYRCSR